jgi:hypothetical protein
MSSSPDEGINVPLTGDPAANAALVEHLTALRRDGSTPIRREAISAAYFAVAQYKVSGNALFLWDALRELTSPEVGSPPITLPSTVASYLHSAAEEIATASLGSDAVGKKAMAALSLGGQQGASAARDYRKHRLMGGLLGIYEVLMERHGAAQAEEMIGRKLNLQPISVRQRLTEARRTMAALFQAAGSPLSSGARTGHHGFKAYSDDQLLDLVKKRFSGV